MIGPFAGRLPVTTKSPTRSWLAPNRPPNTRRAATVSMRAGRVGAGGRVVTETNGRCGRKPRSGLVGAVGPVAAHRLRFLAGVPDSAPEHPADLRQGLRTAPDEDHDQDDDQEDEGVGHGRMVLDATRPPDGPATSRRAIVAPWSRSR